MKPNSAGPKSRFIDNKTNSTHYIDWEGEGPTTVLIHGDMRTSRSFDAVSKNLSKDSHVLAMDLLGHGDSSWIESGYRFTDRSDDIENFVTKTNLNEIHAVAHSTGAVALVMHVADNPSRFKKLVLMEPMIVVDEKFQRMVSDRGNRPRVTWKDHDQLKDFLGKHEVTSKWHPAVIDDVVRHETFLDKDGRVDMKWSSATLRWDERENDYLDLEPALRAISIPILLVVGGNRVDGFRKAFEFENALPNLKTVIISGTGHNMYMERPKAVADVIRKFRNSSPIPERI
ncbi:MAG TPA: alpha/beta hydrolase [Dehalococcoidia bacterium]|jgi:pimeloyl-ACP methyl ester carboxylesterase|nr:alpha/beta hydrolase [Dehalococcoidia bacterium]HIC48663.1 alpha/beta hydrolase [Dehalococcoidia bacterium]